MIRYLKNKNIDKISWDKCINNSLNGLVYAQSWYLDIVSPGWDALIEDDYTTIMPLPSKKKILLHYLIQPKLIQQLGIFSVKQISQEVIKQFIKAIPIKFILRDLNFNSYNECYEPALFTQRVNYELNINKSYSEISKVFKENTKRNIFKAKQYGLKIEQKSLPDLFLENYKLNTNINKDSNSLTILNQIINYTLRNKTGYIIITYDSDNKVIAGAFFIFSMNRLIYLTSFSGAKGKEFSAMFIIIDFMIDKFSNQQIIFDFEGSMVDGIARFFRGFGAQPVTYFRYRYTIPVLNKLFKHTLFNKKLML